MVQERDIRINYHAGSKCKVLASELLRDVFANLVMNSIKHSTGPLTIDIEVTNTLENGKKFCKVIVSDNGPGIPDDIKKVLFNRFIRGSTKARGSGLGLYIVKSLVGDFKGRVWVEDRIPGNYREGCKFIVILPEFDQEQDSL
jgi:signal transduction histidine kinase